MPNLRPFQIFTLAFFGVLAVVAVVLLSGFSPDNDEEEERYGTQVTVWGTFDPVVFQTAFSEISKTDKGFNVVKYQRIDSRTFNETFVNAIAEGRQPDILLLPSSELVRQRSKLLGLSYESISERTFKDKYVDGAEIFARPDGVYAFPLGVDPMVLYWNRDIFATNGFAQPPTTWEYIVSTLVPGITRRDNNRNIQQSAIAFGEFQNIRNAKEIILLLTMQSGSRMVEEDNNRYVVEMNRSVVQSGLPPFVSAVQFFTSFSNSNNQLYSWNRQQQLDRNAFVAGDLAMYFGYGSEVDDIMGQNPNLSFDMTSMPQGASATIRRTYGEFYGFAIPKTSRNVEGAFLVAQILSEPSVAASITEALGIAPAQRAAVALGSADPNRQIILNSALVARAWLDPNRAATDVIMEDMIEDVTSGRESIGEAVGDGEQKIRLAF